MKSKKTVLITLLVLFLAGLGGSTLVLSGMYLYLNPQLPAIDTLRDVKLQVPLRVYTSDNKLIGEFGEKRRTPIRYEDIPKPYIDALLAAEDADFFSHSGVSIKGLIRATSELLLTGRKRSGGSTITMQVARNYYLTLRKFYSRKFKEILLALKIEKELTKEEILELYVNVLFLGNRAHGINAAAQVYYGKDISELSLAQHAMIAGLPKGPSIMNPLVNPSRALERRNWILKRMKELDLIDSSEYETAVAEPVTAKFHTSQPEVSAAYVAEMARAEAIKHLGLAAYTDGYTVYTSIKSNLQESANAAVINGVIKYDSRHGYRGPEQRLALLPELEPKSETPQTELNETKIEKSPVTIDFSPWLESLKNIPVYSDLHPAVVTEVNKTSITVLTKTNEQITIDWEQGLSSLRPYISESSRGPKIKAAEELFSVGDVIRLRLSEKSEWQLTQLPDVQAALVSLNPKNGEILSLVGGFDFGQSNFNRVTQAKRQPGSNFKPFVYTAAIESGMTPATLINDAPIVFDDAQLEGTWRPENDTGKFYGPTRLRKALYRSRNLVSIRVLREIGVGYAINKMGRFGFDPDALPRDLSLALGSAGLRPIDIVTGYAAFANGGFKIEPFLIKRIEDADGRIVYQHFPETVCLPCENPNEDLMEDTENEQLEATALESEPISAPFELNSDPFQLPLSILSQLGIANEEDYPLAPRIIDKQTHFLVDSMLKDVIKRGTGTKARVLKRSDIAGKTGTTNGPNDAWFSGYSPDVVTTTWVGFDQFQPLGNNEFGGTAALPIWIDYMRSALKGKPDKPLVQPPGIATVKIDPETGLRAKPGDPDAIFEYFRTEDVPTMEEKIPTPYERSTTEERVTEELF